jgi:hypothetical protein
MKSPRANPSVERLVIEATGAFVADDAAYARAVSAWELIKDLSFGPRPVAVLPNLDGVPGYWLRLDDAGFDLLIDGGYHDWDCLNALYGGVGRTLSTGVGAPSSSNTWGVVEFDDRVVRVEQLAGDYRTLPHVVDVQPDSYSCTCDCGTNNDTCLDLDGGLLTLIGNLETGQCDEFWFRVTVDGDGGRQLEERDSGIPLDWFRQAPACLHRLRALRSFDAGF